MNQHELNKNLENFDFENILFLELKRHRYYDTYSDASILDYGNLRNRIIKDLFLIHKNIKERRVVSSLIQEMTVDSIVGHLNMYCSVSYNICQLYKMNILDKNKYLEKFFKVKNIENILRTFAKLKDDFFMNAQNTRYKFNDKSNPNLREYFNVIYSNHVINEYGVCDYVLSFEENNISDLQYKIFTEDCDISNRMAMLKTISNKLNVLDHDLKKVKIFISSVLSLIEIYKRSEYKEFLANIDPDFEKNFKCLLKDIDPVTTKKLDELLHLDIEKWHITHAFFNSEEAILILKLNNKFNTELNKLNDNEDKSEIYQNLSNIHNDFIQNVFKGNEKLLNNSCYRSIRDISLEYQLEHDAVENGVIKKEIKRAKI